MVKINYLNCNTAQNGTGTISCEVPDGVPTGVITTPKNWELDLDAETFNTAYINSQIKAKVFVPYLGSIDYEDASEAKDVFTTSTKIKLKTVNGKPGFAMHYSKGYHWHTAAYGANSFDDVNVLLVYDNGVIFAAEGGEGKIKGHTCGMFDTGNFMHQKGGDPQKTIIEFQLTNPTEYNLGGALLDPTANGFNIDVIKGIVDTNILKVSNAGVNAVIKVTAAANGALGIKGLDVDDFRFIGITANLSTATYDTGLDDGTYNLVFDADVSGEWAASTARLYDTADLTYVVSVANVLYQGSSS